MAIFVGFESANSYVKSVSSIPGSKSDIYLNTLTLVEEEEAFNQLNGDKYEDVYEVEIDNKKHYYRVGLPLESSNQESSSSNDIKRYKKLEWKVESLIAIYRQLLQGPDTKDFVYITTGVPTKHAGIPDVVTDIQKQLEGTHKVNGRSFLVREVAVITQGESTYYHELLNERGESNVPFVVRVSKKNLMFVDIGHGTTDFCHIQRLIPGKRSQIPGMSFVWEKLKRIAEKNDKDFKAANAPILGISEQLQESGKIIFNNIAVDVDINQERDKALQNYADKIIDQLSKDGLEDSTYNEIIFCGGGSIGLKRYLNISIAKKYENEGLRSRFRFLENAQEANAQGYLKYGLNVLASNVK